MWNDEDNIKCIIDNKSVVWGGLTNEELNKYKFIFVNLILLYAEKFCKIKNIIEYMFSFCIKHVKKSIIIRLSAENKFRNYSNPRGPALLGIPAVLNNSSHAYARGMNYSTNLNFSQRLESGNFIYPYLVGLIEGDGWFSVSKKGKYIMYEFGIEVSIRDIQLIYKIKKWLGVGTVHIRIILKDDNMNSEYLDINLEPPILSKSIKNNVIFRIRNKSHLKSIIIPIFDKYPMFTNKQFDYIRFRSALLSNTKYSNDLVPYIRPNLSRNNIKNILNTSYFPAWLVGFIEAESCFSIYKPTDSISSIASFEISQTNEEVIILTIRNFLGLSNKLQVDKTDNYRLKVSSVRAIDSVIKSMNRAPIKLQGYKKLQYIIWLKRWGIYRDIHIK